MANKGVMFCQVLLILISYPMAVYVLCWLFSVQKIQLFSVQDILVFCVQDIQVFNFKVESGFNL